MIYTFEEAINILDSIVNDFVTHPKDATVMISAKLIMLEKLLKNGKIDKKYDQLSDEEWSTLSFEFIKILLNFKIKLLKLKQDFTS